ncbi:Esterase-like activity of phytase [Frankia sp. AiPs1]|uniref:esterase-like activity of phytase family protein n=1 Tax=Frankia sp. AiPa1 TaxID=573492 RepID=UPI00202B2642|nr:esterase-like activity of phytase family protein [Frankia sp. AiPa1]MCL9762414.1 esterase-like activity of phytase family protein [Frankia sp. AiPa1]
MSSGGSAGRAASMRGNAASRGNAAWRRVVGRRGGLAVAAVALALPVGLVAGQGTAVAAPGAGSGIRGGSTVPTVTATATLPDVNLKDFASRLIPGSVDDDHGVRLGGIGSDLYPAGRPNEFWTITDRGPNGQIKVDGKNRRTFPVPGFDPAILRVRVEGAAIKVLSAVPITTTPGKPVTGLSNIDGYDETPYAWDATTKLAFNPNGLDTEGLVRTRDGDFWVVDEYSPSLLRISATGKVLARYIPAGVKLTGSDYPVIASLPAILGSRKTNRGFEGVALAPDGRTLYLAVQSPLQVPDSDTGDASRNTRILRFDTASKKVTGEYVYRLQDVTTFDPSAEGDPSELKISSLAAVNDHTLLVDERTDPVARLYTVDLRKATNILGTKWDTATTSPSLESLADPASAGVTGLPKTLAVDLEAVPGMPDKIEGVAVLGPRSIAVANDNDFGLGTFDASGRLVDSGVKSRILLLRLNRPLG